MPSTLMHRLRGWLRPKPANTDPASSSVSLSPRALHVLDLIDQEHVTVFEDQTFRSYFRNGQNIVTAVKQSVVNELQAAGCIEHGDWYGHPGRQQRDWKLTGDGAVAYVEAWLGHAPEAVAS